MRLKDIAAGEVYAVVRYFDRRKHTGIEDGARLEAREWEEAWSSLAPARVLEVGVQVQHYSRPGVRVQWLEPETLEPRTDREGRVPEPDGLLASNVLLPWQVWTVRYHEFVEDRLEEDRRRSEERVREKARRQEKAAKDWMAREFAYAREAIEDVLAIVDPPQVLDGGAGAMAREASDEEVQRLVERRHPEGNPYLTGEREA